MSPYVRLFLRVALVAAVAVAVTALLWVHSYQSRRAKSDDGVILAEIRRLIAESDSLLVEEYCDSAVVLCTQALRLTNECSGNSDSVKASVLSKLGSCLHETGYLLRADSCWHQAVEIGGKTNGYPPLDLARGLAGLGEVNRLMGRIDQAESLLQHAVNIVTTELGADSPEIVGYINQLGNVHAMKGDSIQAKALLKRGLDILERHYDPSLPAEAELLRMLGTQYNGLRRTAQAVSYFRKSYDLICARKGSADRETVQSLRYLADALCDDRQIPEALTLFAEELALSEAVNGPNSLHLARDLRRVGGYDLIMSDYAHAESCLTRALQIYESHEGHGELPVAECSYRLAAVYQNRGQYDKALAYLKQAEAICRERYPTPGCTFAMVLNWLGNTYSALGRSAEAETMYKESLRERILQEGPTGPNVAEASNNLGEICLFAGRYAEAEAYYRKALELREARYGRDYLYLDHSLIGLGNVSVALGKYAEADTFFTRALGLCERGYPADHLHRAWIAEGSGNCRRAQGRYAEAESLYLQALKIYSSKFSENHSKTIPVVQELALLYGSMNKVAEACARYSQLLHSRQGFVGETFSYLSEEQKMRFLNENPLLVHSLLSLALLDQTPETKRLALDMILRGKGAVADAVAAARQRAFCSYDDDLRQAAEFYGRVCGYISTLTLAAWKAEKPEECKDSLTALHRIKDSLEIRLSACSDFEQELVSRRFSVREVAEALPQDAVLWEYVVSVPYTFHGSGSDLERKGEPRLIALSLDHFGRIDIYDLGGVRTIDSLIARLREAIYEYSGIFDSSLAEEAVSAFKEAASKLYRLVFAPLERDLGGRTGIFVSPDGQLSLVPFEVLLSDDGRYLIEKYRISYLSCGRDLLESTKRRESSDWALLVSDPDYSASGKVVAAEKAGFPRGELASTSSETARLRGGGGCLEREFDPLPQTLEEVDSILSALRQSPNMKTISLYGDQAREDVFAEMLNAPRILHLATHGFFCGDAGSGVGSLVDNPLIRSGIALAGANSLVNHQLDAPWLESDGILTAFEVSGLDLNGTELAVLSSCETGVGEAKNGEGVFGLRRAFQVAGAQTVVMSLWRVPDRETCKLMGSFYRDWVGGKPKLTALRQSMLSLLESHRRQDGFSHPFYWGGFVLVGNPQ